MKEIDINEQFELAEAAEDQPVVVTIVNSETGEEIEYTQDLVLPVAGKTFALLVPLEELEHNCCEDEACSCHHHDEEDDETAAIVARMDFDENGEPRYVEPTDEEYEIFLKAYEDLDFDEDEFNED